MPAHTLLLILIQPYDTGDSDRIVHNRNQGPVSSPEYRQFKNAVSKQKTAGQHKADNSDQLFVSRFSCKHFDQTHPHRTHLNMTAPIYVMNLIGAKILDSYLSYYIVSECSDWLKCEILTDPDK